MHTHDESRPQGPIPRDKAAQEAENMQASEQASESLREWPEPPFYNMGDTEALNPLNNNEKQETKSFRFDWYQATLSQEVEPLQALRWASFLGESRPMKAINGYAQAHDFGQLKILYGGHSGKYGVHVIIHGGDACHQIVDALRAQFPDHRPTRIDVCLDFRADKAWDTLALLGRRAARKYDIQTTTQGDWLEGKRGRTLYIGGRQSIFRARIYEKGHELRSKGKVPDAPLDWVRVEFQVRPPRHNRALCATMTADQVAQSGSWSRFICNSLGTLRVPTCRINTRRPKPEVVDSFEAMADQYSGVIAQIKREEWMTKDQYQRIMERLWDEGRFNGLPGEVLRSWYF